MKPINSFNLRLLLRKPLIAVVLIFTTLYTANAQTVSYSVGDSMPDPTIEHFAVAFSITCSSTDTVRVDRYEYKDKTSLYTYRNDSETPYGLMLVHRDTLILDNDPQDGRIDRIEVLSLDNDITICSVLP